jgi:hypothetical protein
MYQQEEFEDAQEPPQPPLQQPLQPQQPFNLKIPPFWASNFYHVLGALPESTVRGLDNLMLGPLPPDAYLQLKTRLLAAHTLTEFQRMDKLLSAQPFGGQKPSDLLHELVQYCP